MGARDGAGGRELFLTYDLPEPGYLDAIFAM